MLEEAKLLEEGMSAKQHKGSQGAPLSRRSVMTSAVSAAASTGLISAAGAQTGAGAKPAPNVRFIQPDAIYKTATPMWWRSWDRAG